MSNKIGLLHIIVSDDGFRVYSNAGQADFDVNGKPGFRMGDIDQLPEKLQFTDSRKKTIDNADAIMGGLFSIRDGEVFVQKPSEGGVINQCFRMNIGIQRDNKELRLKDLQEQIDKFVTERIQQSLRPGGLLYRHNEKNLGGFARDCAARFAGSTCLPFGGFPKPKRKVAITISGLEQWKNGVVSGATVKVDVMQKGAVIHSEVFSGKSTAEFSREVTIAASFDDIITVHDRPDLPNIKVSAKFI